MNPIARTANIGALFLAFAVISSCHGPTNYYFQTLKIDSGQHLLPIGTRSLVEPVMGSYYYVFHGSFLTSVEHFEKKSGAKDPEVSFHLETHLNQLLDRTVKEDVILTGPFGTVYAKKVCFFNRPVASSYNSISVGSYYNKAGETPSELSGTPQDLPPLTSLSLVRIFRAVPEFLVVSASYEATGELSSLDIAGTKEGNWTPISFGGTFYHLSTTDPRLERYGIPPRLDVQAYLRAGRLPLSAVALTQELTVINQHYGYDKMIRQDKLLDGAAISSRFLRPSVTEEEQTLDPVCESRFRQQRSMGVPTAE